MLDDITLALLGDHEAAERVTKKGVLLPCAHCKGRAVLAEGTLQAPGRYSAVCGECFTATTWCVAKEDAIGRWNTRAPILSAEEMERLEADSRNATVRSKTFPDIAKAMAEQWGGLEATNDKREESC